MEMGDLHVISKTSTEKYRQTNLSIKEIADELSAIITPDALAIIETIPTANITAYDIFLRARDQHNQFWLYSNVGALEDAILLYRRALEYDSTFARAYTGLALVFRDKHNFSTYLDENYLDSVLVLAKKALSFDDKLDEAYYVRGRYYASQPDGFNKSLQDMNRALEINPNYVQIYEHKSVISAWVFEDYIDAIKNEQMAVKLDQSARLPINLKNLAGFYSDLGFFEEAEYYFNEQVRWCEESMRLKRSYATMYGAHHDLACVLAFKGDTERAIQLLAEINDNKNFFVSWYISQFENEPFFESIHDDQRYQKILVDMKAKNQKEHDRIKNWLERTRMN